MKFAIFGNCFQAKKSLHAETLFTILKQHGAEIFVDWEFYDFLTKDLHFTPKVSGLIGNDDFSVDMVICIGGDGTFLKAASRVGRKTYLFWESTPDALAFLLMFPPKKWTLLLMKFTKDNIK
jgi:ATP-NAD kinase.